VAHTQRVLAKRAAVASRAAGGKEPATAGKGRTPKQAAEQVDPELAALAGAAPKVGSRPAAGKRSGGNRSGGRGGRPGGGRPSGGAKRR
jgi:preprotein translocase subunit SecF